MITPPTCSILFFGDTIPFSFYRNIETAQIILAEYTCDPPGTHYDLPVFVDEDGEWLNPRTHVLVGGAGYCCDRLKGDRLKRSDSQRGVLRERLVDLQDRRRIRHRLEDGPKVCSFFNSDGNLSVYRCFLAIFSSISIFITPVLDYFHFDFLPEAIVNGSAAFGDREY